MPRSKSVRRMIYAIKLRERTLGSKFLPEEVPTLLGVDTNYGLKLFREMARDCWVVPVGKKFKVVVGDERQRVIDQNIEMLTAEINELYQLFNHIKSLKDEKAS